MNRNRENLSSKLSNPYESANFISKYLYWWLKDLFKIGLSKEINEEDLYKCSSAHTSAKVSRRFEMLWEREMAKEKPSLIKVTLKVYWYNVMIVGLFFSIVSIACK